MSMKEHSKDIEKSFLHAAECRDLETVKAYIKNGGNPNCYYSDRVTALHVAAERGDLELAKILLSSGKLNLNCFTNHGYPPLIISSISRQLDLVVFLLRNGADVNITERFGKTALHHVVMVDCLPLAKVLIAFGANLNALDTFYQTPLSEAVVRRSFLPMVKLLVKNRADVNFNRGELVSHLFFEACLQCHNEKQLDVIQYLLQHGVNPNLQHPQTRRNALHLVGISGYLPLAKELVKRGTRCEHIDYYNKMPFEIAQMHGNKEAANFLKHHGKRQSIKELLPFAITQ